MKQTVRLVVFSDLDGTLLDHETYEMEPARPALERLAAGDHFLVLASSKTAAEMAPIREQAGFAHCPAIIENGAGILPPEGAAEDDQEAGDRVAESADQREGPEGISAIRQILSAMPQDLRACFSGFGDWSCEEISRITGLALPEAERAAMRRFSEPGLWHGSENALRHFRDQLAGHGLVIQRGGRFWTISSGRTKADAMSDLLSNLTWGGHSEQIIRTLALGDAPNDEAMLARADHAIIIPNPANQDLTDKLRTGLERGTTGTRQSFQVARSAGPKGWCEAILNELNQIENGV